MEHVTIEGNKAKFKAELQMEGSWGAYPIGTFDNEMEFYPNKENDGGMIEWVYTDEGGEEDVEHIGIWAENKVVTDYDGVFDLPKEAVYLLEQLGYDLSEIA